MALNNYQDADFTPDITPSDINPTMGTYNSPKTFRFWCQKVLPLVYDNSLSYYELLCKVVDYLNKTMEDVNTAVEDVDNLYGAFGNLQNHVNASETALLQAYNDLQDYVNTYFNNLDVQEEINNKLDTMAEDGTLDTILLPYFNEYVETTNEIIDDRFEEQNDVLDSQNDRISVLEGRMDEFSRLPDGSLSTSADAELVDIRVGDDGTTYPTAGDAVRGQISDLSEKTRNLLNYHNLVASNISISDDIITGTATNLYLAFGNSNGFTNGIEFEENTQYTLSFDAKTDGNDGTSGAGIQFIFYYTDDSTEILSCPNSIQTYTSYSKTSAPGKTLSRISVGYATNGSNVWYIKGIQVEKGNTKTAYIPFITAYDRIAREEIENINAQTDELQSLLQYGYDSIPVVANGSFSAAGGVTTGTENKIRTDLIPFSAGDRFVIENGTFEHACGSWEGSVSQSNIRINDGAFISITDTITFDYSGYLVVVFKKHDNSNIEPSAFDGLIKKYDYKLLNDLTQNMDDVKSTIHLAYKDIIWEYGSLNNGQNVNYIKNMRSRDIIHVGKGSTIRKTAGDSALSVAFYQTNDLASFIRGEQVLTQGQRTTYTFESDCYIRPLLQYVGTGTADLDYLSNYYDFKLINPSSAIPTVKLGILGYSSYLGNAITIQFNDSSTMMVDSFSAEAWTSIHNDLLSRGITHLDRFMLTHWHSDHCGCIPKLIEDNYIDADTIVYLPQDLDTTATGALPGDWGAVVDHMETILPLLSNSGCTIVYPTEGQIVKVSDCYLKFWNCDHSVFYPNGTYPSQNYNDWSLCAYLFVGDKNMCFTGDLGPIGQKKMVDLNTMIKANLYTATHHGWDNGNSSNYYGLLPEWINRLQPDVVFSEDYSAHATYIDTKGCPQQTWCEKNHVPNYRTYINGSMNVLLTSTEWKLLGAYSNYIRGGINWYYDYNDYITDTKIAILSDSLLKPKYITTSGVTLLRNAIIAMLGSEYNTSAYKFSFRVRVLDNGNNNAYLEYTVTDFNPQVAGGAYSAGTRTKVLGLGAHNSVGTVEITGLTGTPHIVVEMIEYSAV